MHGFDGLYPQQVDQLVVGAGFELVEQFCYDHLQPFSHRAWVGRMRTCNGVGSGKLSEEQVKVGLFLLLCSLALAALLTRVGSNGRRIWRLCCVASTRPSP
jgi:hypothetical protein